MILGKLVHETFLTCQYQSTTQWQKTILSCFFVLLVMNEEHESGSWLWGYLSHIKHIQQRPSR